MAKRGMNIYKRKDGRWEGRYRDGVKPDGSIKYRSIYGKSYSTVKERLTKIKAFGIEAHSICNMTVKTLFWEWLSVVKVKTKESTYANYCFKVEKHLLPFFGAIKFDQLSPKIVYDFMQRKQIDGFSAKYISDIIVVLKSMAKYTTSVYQCHNAISDVKLPKKEKKELSLYNSREQDILKRTLLRKTDLTKLGILLCLFTGIRIGELCSLKWSDVDLEKKLLSINKTVQRIQCSDDVSATKLIITSPKSKSSVRIIPLPEFLIDCLKDFQTSKDVFLLSNKESVIDPRTIQYRFHSILKKAKLPSMNFHSLRHLFATNCIALGFDIKTLSEILGHNSVEVTLNQYVHSSMERKKECMDLLELTV